MAAFGARAAACLLGLAAAFVLLLGLAAPVAQAQTEVILVHNTSVIGTATDNGISKDRAQAFTAGSNANGYKLTKVRLNASAALTLSLTYTVSIHSDSSSGCGTGITSCPGAELTGGTLTNPASLPFAATLSDYTASGDGIDLSAGTKYWVVWDVSATNLQSGSLLRTSSNDEDTGAAADWSIGDDSLTRSHSATSWTSSSDSVRVSIRGYAKTPAATTGVEISSTPSLDVDGDNTPETYGLGEKIRVQVTFDKNVTVTGTPRLKIKMDPNFGEFWANYESGSGSKVLTFAYTVATPNMSPGGIAVLQNSLALNGGTIQDEDSVAANLAHDGKNHDPAHKVNSGLQPATPTPKSPASQRPRFASGFGPLRLEPDAAMTPVTLPAATGGGGAPYTYSLTSSPAGLAGLTFDATTRTLSGTPEAEGQWSFSYTAHDNDSDTSNSDAARLVFRVTVGVAFEEQQQVVTRTLAAVASRTAASALANIGARLGDAVPPAGLSLAGGTGTAGMDSAGPPGGARSRGMEAGELLGSSAFSLASGAAEGEPGFDPDALRWGVWGRGDYGAFEGRPDAVSSYRGDTRTGWLGADARAGRWVAGLAVSRGTSETDYALEGEKGRIETTLTALWPYGRWTFANGLELRGLAGAGSGTARHVLDGDAPRETSRLTMRAGSLGVRQAFAPLDGFDLAARADASFARMETAKGEEAVDGLRADSWRLRGGLEASKRFALKDDATLSPFAELAARRDGGDGPAGSGIELAGGLRYAAAGVSVEARGRWLAAHSEKGVRERGLSATVRLDPEAGGRGLSLSLTPRWGAQAGGAGALWREDAPQASGASDAGALDARLGWGFALAPEAGGVLTPFAEAGLAGGDDRRLRLGTRFEVRRGALALELAGERRERASARPEHIVGLELRVGF